jgi:S1-C subfamily serine protease/tRNA A-37 threonylcarbamoyl transferase component Bud32
MPDRPHTPRPSPPAAELPREARDRLDQALARFRAAWRRGERPDPAGHLADTGPERPVLLAELCREDIEQRLRAGEAARVEDYLRRFPDLRQQPAAVVDLLAAEYLARAGRGEGVRIEEYRQRFPANADSLRRVLAARQASAPAGGRPRAEAPVDVEPGDQPRTVVPLVEPVGGATPQVPSGGDDETRTALSPSPADRAKKAAARTIEGSAIHRVTIPGFEILDLLGDGGMGVVYKARHQRLGRLVALKVIKHADYAGPTERRRFTAEAEAIARLQHPNIVQIFEVGEHDGLPFFALEYCAGGSLDKKLGGRPLPPMRASGIVEKLARAVHAAHKKGVIHRDLKPGNILLTEDGTPKVGDFGLAKRLDTQGKTTTGVVMGTPSYMSPEQANGLSKDIGPATDVWALGAVLYELLTGRPPFKAESSFDTVLQVIQEEPAPPSRLNAKVPRDLEAICLKCLQKDIRRRYASAAELAKDLQRFRDGEAIRARPVGAVGRLLRTVRRRKEFTYFAGGALACAVLMAVVLVLSRPRATPPVGAVTGADAGTGGGAKPAWAARAPEQLEVQGPAEEPGPIEPRPVPAGADKPAAKPPEDEAGPAPRDGQIPRDAVEKVKKATVLLHVVMAGGGRASGTGFFGVRDGRSLVLTNAHVVGMLSAQSQPPRSVEAVLHSGLPGERKLPARVLGVDRTSDLAVLDVGDAGDLPEPLRVTSAAGLAELDKLYTFGFPLGEQLGKEITVRPTSVSALRRKNGSLHRIQVNGGMDPGNSGGPVADPTGRVVGVAVAGIEGRLINFAIPADHVRGVLAGRVAGLAPGQPYAADGGRLALPVEVEMSDPCGRVREVALDLWTGDDPEQGRRTRPAGDGVPAARPGDSPRLRCPLPYADGTARGDVLLPMLPEGKVYWLQAYWVSAPGGPRWGDAVAWSPDPAGPVSRRPAELAFRGPTGPAVREVVLSSSNALRHDESDDESPPWQSRWRAVFGEKVVSPAPGLALHLEYRNARRENIENKEAKPDEAFAAIQDVIHQLSADVRVDGFGNVTQSALDEQILSKAASRNPRLQQRVQAIQAFHEPVAQALAGLAVALPNREVRPRQTWKGTRPVLIDTPESYLHTEGEVTFTYLGRRQRDGRDEAVIAFAGPLHGNEIQGGHFAGVANIDLATGQVVSARGSASAEAEVNVMTDKGPRTTHLHLTQELNLERKP